MCRSLTIRTFSRLRCPHTMEATIYLVATPVHETCLRFALRNRQNIELYYSCAWFFFVLAYRFYLLLSRMLLVSCNFGWGQLWHVFISHSVNTHIIVLCFYVFTFVSYCTHWLYFFKVVLHLHDYFFCFIYIPLATVSVSVTLSLGSTAAEWRLFYEQ